VIEGTEHLHKHQIVHCDLKAENVVVGAVDSSRSAWRAQIIDFGCARKMGDKLEIRRASYMSPEHDPEGYARASLDTWGLGTVMFEMTIGTNLPNCKERMWEEVWLKGLLHAWASEGEIGSDPAMQEALCGLLSLTTGNKASDRWTLQQIKDAKVLAMRPPGELGKTPSIMDQQLPECPLVNEPSPETSIRSIRYCRIDIPMVSFILKVSGELVGQSFGPEGLDLGRLDGILVIYIERADGTFVRCPGPKDVFKEDDHVFMARDPSRIPRRRDMSMTPETLKKEILMKLDDPNKLLHFQVWPEFDEFDIPETCWVSRIAPEKGKKWTNFRKAGINLIAVKRPNGDDEEIYGPEAIKNLVLQKGDIAVVARVPCGKKGFSARLVKQEQIDSLETLIYTGIPKSPVRKRHPATLLYSTVCQLFGYTHMERQVAVNGAVVLGAACAGIVAILIAVRGKSLVTTNRYILD
jgi:hypothetical protein